MFCNKSILVQSNLATDQLKYKTIPGEFNQHRWNIAIASVAFESNKTLSFPCFVTCNFVTEKLINDASQLVNYEQPLCSFFFDTKPNSSKKLVRQGKSFSFPCKRHLNFLFWFGLLSSSWVAICLLLKLTGFERDKESKTNGKRRGYEQ